MIDRKWQGRTFQAIRVADAVERPWMIQVVETGMACGGGGRFASRAEAEAQAARLTGFYSQA